MWLCVSQVLNTDFSPQAAAACMNRLAKLSARFIGDRGFSIGIDDVTPAPALLVAKQKLMTDGYGATSPYIREIPSHANVNFYLAEICIQRPF